MKKKISKYNSGGIPPAGKIKSKTVVKSGDGNYRTVEKSTSSPSGYSESSKTRRTIKGVVAGAPKPNRNPMMGPPPTTAPLMTPPSKKPLMAKKGGSVKKKK
jgi:hypothetical protein